MDFRTKKCNHNEKGRCFHCLAAQVKAEKKNKEEATNPSSTATNPSDAKCTHPPNMKCLRCMSQIRTKQAGSYGGKCQHSDFEHCANCVRKEGYETFDYYLSRLEEDCKHRKPCKKCLPPQARKTFGVDRECRNHLPYPQAQCDSCMAPTISLKEQNYTHVNKVVIRTTAIYRVTESSRIGILLGREEKGEVFVEDVYFPKQQSPNCLFLSPEVLDANASLFSAVGLEQVGIIYSSPDINPMSLSLSAVFQDNAISLSRHGYQISKFITMRLHWDEVNPYFECFMVSDLFQALHRNKLVFETQSRKNYFELITAKNDRDSASATFLREGVETDIYYFREIVVWLDTIYEESFFTDSHDLAYPYFTLDDQKPDNIEMLTCIQTEDPFDKYRNVQFLLHIDQLFGRAAVLLFLNQFIYEAPELFLQEKLKEYKSRERRRMKSMEEANESFIYEQGFM